MYSDKQYARLTKLDLAIKFNSADNEAGRRRVALLIRSSKSFAHPDYPQNKSMRMYRVLLSMIDGQRKATQHLTDLKVEGALKDPDAASVLMERHEKDEAIVTSFESGDPEKDAEVGSADKKRFKKNFTPAQEEAKNVRAEKTRKTVFMKKLIRDIEINKHQVDTTIATLNGLSESGSSGITAQNAILQSFLEPVHNLLDSSKSILVGEKFEEMRSQKTAYDNSFGFGEPLAEYKQELLIAEGRIRKSVKDNATPKE